MPVEQHADGSMPAMFDFEFTTSDGREGPAEMTTLTAPDALRWDRLTPKGRDLPGSSPPDAVIKVPVEGRQLPRARTPSRHATARSDSTICSPSECPERAPEPDA